MKKQNILIMVLLTILNLSLNLTGQVAVNTTGDDPNTSSMLDVSSTNKGILIPRMTLSQRNDISNPVTGLMIFQTDNTPGFYFYNGSAWVVVGDGATSINSLYDGITDSYSLFLGEGSGAADDGTDNRNTAVGINAYNASVSGYANTAFGNEALKLNTTGTHNAVFGTQALTSNLTGIENTVIGTNAGFNVTGSGNILIGSNAAFSETDISNKLYIDNSSTGTPLLYGDFSTNLLRINGTFDINNAYRFPITAGTNGQLLKTDGSGNLSWADDTNTGATSINELSDAATDNNSLFLGIDAGGNDDGTTNFNTGTGVWSLKEVISGSHNSAFGTTALQNLTTGSQNTALGTGALNSNSTGSDNTAIGKEAGKDVTGSGNIFIGNEAAKTQTAISNKLYIDNSDTVAPLIYGDFETNTVRINHKLELASDSTGSSLKLFEPDTAGVHYTMFKTQPQDTSITYYLPDTLASVGQVLKYNGQDKLGWSNDVGATSINGLSDGKTIVQSVYLGDSAGESDGGSYNFYNSPFPTNCTGVGYAALKVSTGEYNTAFGSRALYSNTTGSSNTALGCEALASNTTGYSNNAVGDMTLFYNTTGFGNNAFGNIALRNNQTGSYNSAFGEGALLNNQTGSYNTAYGAYALFGNGEGDHNTGVGYNALQHNLSGSNNTVIGYYAGFNTGNMSGSVLIGYQAGKGSAGSNNLYIDNSDTPHPLIWGNFDSNEATINGNLNVTGILRIDGDQIEINDLSDAKTDNSSIFLGNLSGDSVSGNNYSTALGIGALAINSTGNNNTAIGSYSLNSNTTGSSNIAIGSDALGDNSSGHSNMAIGYYSLGNNTTGHHNVAIGRSSLTENQDGNYNTTTGADSGPDGGNTSLSNTGTFGYNTKSTSSNYFRIGNSNVSSIGGQVGWSTYSDGRFKRNVQQNVPGLDFILKLKPVSYNWDIHKLDDFIGATEGTEKSEHMREARRQQEAKTYTGFVAQEVEKVAQDIGYDFSGVETPPNDATPYSIRYAEFVVPLVKAVQEQQEMIEAQQQMINELRREIEELKKQY